MDQGRPTEKPKISKTKVMIRLFRSSKQDENKGEEEDGRDSTTENAQDEAKAAIGERRNTDPNTVSPRTLEFPLHSNMIRS